jgi:hypothetical protein
MTLQGRKKRVLISLEATIQIRGIQQQIPELGILGQSGCKCAGVWGSLSLQIYLGSTQGKRRTSAFWLKTTTGRWCATSQSLASQIWGRFPHSLIPQRNLFILHDKKQLKRGKGAARR